MNDPLSEALNGHLDDPLDEVNLRLAVAASDIAELRAEIARLDRDLEEARRLNVRAAELLLLVCEQVSGAQASPGPCIPGGLARTVKEVRVLTKPSTLIGTTR